MLATSFPPNEEEMATPRQADLLWVVGTVSQRQAPILKRVYEQIADPKWVIAMGACACTGGERVNR